MKELKELGEAVQELSRSLLWLVLSLNGVAILVWGVEFSISLKWEGIIK